MAESRDACWWLSSGAILTIDRGVARTNQGALPVGTKWRDYYVRSNPVDTDNGVHPQNLFRLVTRESWVDYRQEVSFRILKLNLATSPERGEWSGVFLFQRYQDSDNLYYAGVRMDGTAVIKKKRAGKYFTLAQRPLYTSPTAYHRSLNPSLLPMGKWVTLSSTIRTAGDGVVHIRLLTRDDRALDGWRAVVEALDSGQFGTPITAPGHGGIRSDFMDVEFEGYIVTGD